MKRLYKRKERLARARDMLTEMHKRAQERCTDLGVAPITDRERACWFAGQEFALYEFYTMGGFRAMDEEDERARLDAK